MGMSRYEKSRIINNLNSILFICSSVYLAFYYYHEHPNPQLHWEGIFPLLFCLIYFLFFTKN